MKKTPMPPRTTPLSRNTVIGRQNATSRKPSPSRTPVRTGPDQKTRGLVLARDNWQCVSCGKPAGGNAWWSIQHRVARGVGGGNSLQNLIVLCGSATSAGCHRDAENRTAESHARGYWLRSDENPALVPVLLHGRVLAWLDDSGGYSFQPPAEVA
jgi:5-methylcytosine-specific restriction endonuclease McrA